MRIAGKEINDECSKCGNILECELFRQGHGIKQERENVAKMIECQMKHREKREKNGFKELIKSFKKNMVFQMPEDSEVEV